MKNKKLWQATTAIELIFSCNFEQVSYLTMSMKVYSEPF